MRNTLFRNWHVSLALACSLALASCSGDGASPMAPSAGPAGPATIQGLVNPSVSGAVSFAATAAQSNPLSVSVRGTDLTADVDGNGGFRIPNVPPGRVHLRFLGAGTDAVLDIGIVESNQTVDVIVRVSGNTAALESEASDDSPSESVDSASDDDSVDTDSTDDDSMDDTSTDDGSADAESTDDDSVDDDSADDDSADDDSVDSDDNDDDSADDDSTDDS